MITYFRPRRDRSSKLYTLLFVLGGMAWVVETYWIGRHG